MSVRWLIATAVVLLIFGLTWTVAGTAYDLGRSTSLEVAAVVAVVVGLPMSWWSFRGQLLDEPAEVAWVTWRRVPAEPAHPLVRAEDEARLEAAFGAGQPTVVVITGAPGTGKTELAASYVRARLAVGWPMVAWVDAATEEELLAGLLEFADALSLRVPEEDSTRACERLRQHPPAGTRPSLIVFDGVTDVEAVRPYLPGGDGWRVLATSSAPGAGRLGTEVALEPLSRIEVTAQTELPVEFDTDHAVRRILGLLSVLSPGGVSRNLLYAAEETAKVDDVLDRISRRRLLSSRMDGDGVFLPELTRSAVAERLRAEHALPAAVAAAAELLARATFSEDQAWDRRLEGDQLVAHIAALTASAGSVAATLPVAAGDRMLGLRHWATRQLGAAGDGHRAVRMAETSRAECAVLLGPEHPDTLVAADNMVIAQAAAGRAADGIPLAEGTLSARERVLGAAHPDTLASRYTLAYAHEYAGRMEEAAALYERAFTEYARVYGVDHPQTVTVGSALARARVLRPAPARHRPAPQSR